MQRQTRFMDGSGKGKRSLEGDEGQQPVRKRPALASVIVEALKVDSLQKLCSSLEPILRRIVSEEVERALAKLAPSRLNGSSSPKRIDGLHERSMQLHFRSKPCLPLFTGGKVEGEQGAAIHVVLIDGNTGQVVTTGEESSMKLDVVVLEGDFNNEDDEGWTQEEFETHVVTERDGKRPLLTGDLHITLKEGVGTLGELTFTDNSSWIRSRKFRLGLRVSSGLSEGLRIREAKTEAFTVKDHRGELYKKHYPPALNDEVWRLEKIGKDGAFHKKLNNAGIFSVEDFLRLLVKDQQKLRNILGGGMSNKMWEALVDHAKTCVLSGKFYVYYDDDSGSGVVFNSIYELNGLITEDLYIPADSLSDSQKVYVDTLVKKAYDNWNQVIDYDGKSLANFKQCRRSTRLQMGTGDYPNVLAKQKQQPRLPASVPSIPSEQVHPSLQVGGYNGNVTTRYTSNSVPMNFNLDDQFNSNSFSSQAQLVGTSHQLEMRNNNVAGLALGPLQSSALGQSSNLNMFDDWSHTRDRGADDFLTEEEIRLKSHEMLENEDMQHLLHLFSMGGNTSLNMHDDGYSFESFVDSPTQSFDEDRSRPGKAVVSWLKIKAAMRWGFFIRKKAAERRAQIVELEDDEE